MANQSMYYDQESLWDQAPLPYQTNVRDDLSDVLPQNIKSILDVGCGDGFVTNALPETIRVVGLDFSRQALKYVNREAVAGSVTNLPFSDHEFDMVMANDVIEHLQDHEFRSAISELERVASQYILVTVPFMENLNAGKTLCGLCGTSYHINHHQRSFGIIELTHIFSDIWNPISIVFSGSKIDPIERIQWELRSKLGIFTQWEKAVCPKCGNKASISMMPDKKLSLIYSLGHYLESYIPKHQPEYNECIVIFSRQKKRPENHDHQLSLVGITNDGIKRIIDTKISSEKNHVILLPKDPSELYRYDRIMMEWRINSTEYLYPRPIKSEKENYLVPLWFTPDKLLNLSSEENSYGSLISDSLFFNALTAHQLESKTVELQNCRAEIDILKIRSGQQEQLQIDLQNAHAELDALKLKLGRYEQVQIDIQNVRAESDALKRDIQNAQIESNALKSDIQNARTELDILKSKNRLFNNFRTLYQKIKNFRIWQGGYRSFEAYRHDILELSKPSLQFSDWGKVRRGKSSFLMVCHDQEIDRRIIQQATALYENGWEGIIIALSFDGNDKLETVNDIRVHRISLNRIVPDCPVYWNYQNNQRRILNFGRCFMLLSKFNWLIYKIHLKIAYHGKNIHYPLPFDNAFSMAIACYPADLVVAHDLPALKAGSLYAKKWGVPLIYDTHEMYTALNGLSRRQRLILDRRERKYISGCSGVITVSKSIAKALSDKYGIIEPTVILNVAPEKHLSLRPDRDLHRLLKLNENEKIMLYQGGIVSDPNRNLSVLLKGFLQVTDPTLHLVFMGPAAPDMLEHLKSQSGRLLDQRIHFLPPVPQDTLLNYTTSADFGVIPYKPLFENDICGTGCMPNKFFEYISACLPILAHEKLLEIKYTMDEIGGGGVCADLADPDGMAHGIRAILLRDLKKDREILKKVRERFSWDYEKSSYLTFTERIMANYHGKL